MSCDSPTAGDPPLDTHADVVVLADFAVAQPADVLLFHPVDPAVFLVGSYLLDETTRRRHGRVSVFKLKTGSMADADAAGAALLLAETDCDAVLDMKWYQSRLYVAHSTGSISILECTLDHGGDGCLLKVGLSRSILDPEVLIMSLSVSPKGLLTSHSDGSVATWTHNLLPISRWAVSDLEVWIQARSQDGHLVYSGADDGTFAAWDTRAISGETEASPIFKNRRTHGAGVTALLPDPVDDGMILTGSYDDKIRRFDLRNTNRPILEENLGGGVWRIIPKGKDELTICCMYDGAKVIKEDSFQLVKEWKGHESMVYGGDVTEDGLIGTCSFYDRRVCVWR